MRYLLSSIALLLFVSCVSYSKKNGFINSTEQPIENPYFSDTSIDYVYKADIEAFGNSFGGIFVVKKLGTDYHRIAFTTELGNKIFDFTFKGEDFTVNHILKRMDKKILINLLKNDFRVLVNENPTVVKSFRKNSNTIYKTLVGNKKYYHWFKEKDLSKIVNVTKGKKKVEFTFSEINDNIVHHIQIFHHNIRLKINLKAI